MGHASGVGFPYGMLRVSDEMGPHHLHLTREIENNTGWRLVLHQAYARVKRAKERKEGGTALWS
jgi:hypothetical protein